MFKFCISAAGVLLAAAPLQAQGATPLMQVSIGVREVGAGGGAFPGLGGAATGGGAIEWVDLDTQILPLDGNWYQFSFTLPTAQITAFTGNSQLDGTWGSLEHIRVKNFMDFSGNVSLHVDDLTITTTQGSFTEDFESWLAGDEVIFQEPCYSGSTQHHFAIYDPNAMPPRCVQVPEEITHQASVDSSTGYMSFQSYNATFRFLAPTPPASRGSSVAPGSRWLRMTTWNALNNPVPCVRFDQNCTVSFMMRAVWGSKAEFSGTCPGVYHSMNGPVLSRTGSAAFNDNLTLQADNLIGALCALLVGTEINPGIPVDLIGGLPGSQLCVAEFAQVPCLGLSTVSVTLPIGSDPSLAGLVFAAQALDFDPSGTSPLSIGFSDTLLFSPGDF